MEDIEIIELTGLSENVYMTLCGPQDKNLKALSQCINRDVSFRDDKLIIHHCDAETKRIVARLIAKLLQSASEGKVIEEQDVIYTYRLLTRNEDFNASEMSRFTVGRTLSGKAIMPKTNGQKRFIQAMNENTITFAIGPAGTGKTYLAVIQAVSALKKNEVKRIVLTRPAVEAGENLGFLPGDLKEKVDPYLTPLYDALHVMLGNEKTELYIEKGIVEIAPLAYMRGRTMDDCYVILDEAQNTTASQMKMFLTRLGFHSKMVITGDITQIDLDHKTTSGLLDASRKLQGLNDIAIVQLNSDDVVRHPLVQKIIERYEK